MAQLTLKRDALSWREVDGEILALDLDGSRYLATNEAGALLWNELAKGTTHDALVAILVDQYGLERDHARADVETFIRDLAEQGLLAA
jgi:hypothetical protein